jgi:WD40 repeat protein
LVRRCDEASRGRSGLGQKGRVFDFNAHQLAFLKDTIPGNHVLAVSLTPDGKHVAAGSKHLAVGVLDISTGDRVFFQLLHRSFVSAVAWSPDGKTLASASYDGIIRLSSPLDPKVVTSQLLSGHAGEINALIWTRLPPRGAGVALDEALFSGGADGTLRAWAPAIDGDSALSGMPANWLAAARWSPDGTRIAACYFRDYVHVFDAASGASFPLPSSIGYIFDLAWSPNGDRLATASRLSGLVEIFDVSTYRTLKRFAFEGADRLSWSPSGNFLAAGSTTGTRIWNAQTDQLLTSVDQASGSLAWHPDERRIALGGKDGSIAIWDAFTGHKIADWRAAPPASLASIPSKEDPPRQVLDLRWSPDGRELAFGTQDSAAGVLTAPDGQLTRTFAGHPTGVWRVAWSPNGRRVATSGQDGVVRVFEAATGNPVANFNHGFGNLELHAVDWSPDSRELLSGGYDRMARIWDSLRGSRIDEIGELELRVQEQPQNLSALLGLAQSYARLGWADRARTTFTRASELAPNDTALTACAMEAESWMADALTGTAFRPNRPKGALQLDPRALALLNTIHFSWEWKQPESAVYACRELLKMRDAQRFQRLVWAYLGRADWKAKWFASPLDPRDDLVAWRALSTKPGAMAINVRLLDFLYHRQSPKTLLVASKLSASDLPADRFGMIARARMPLPAGKWRFHVRGNDGIRVIVDGETIIDDWTGAAPIEQSGDFERATAGEANVIVEHYALKGAEELQVLLELVE